MDRKTPSSRRNRVALAIALAASALLGGCGLLYQNTHREANFVLYSDLSREFLAGNARTIKQIYHGFAGLFEVNPQTLGNVTFIFKGDSEESQVIDFSYSPSLLGYYMPFFDLIAVDTTPVWAREPELLKQILLHEITHQFVIHEYPGANQECWLNEGLAGNLEMAVFEDGHFEYPLLNSTLFQIASAALRSKDPSATVSMSRLIDMHWTEFHDAKSKEIHYALAWSVIYYLLERHFPAEWPLGKKIKNLYHLNRNLIKSLEPEWIDFLKRFDFTEKLIELASRRERLLSLWAIQQLGSVKNLNRLRALSVLLKFAGDADLEKRYFSQVSFLRLLSQVPHFVEQSELRGIVAQGKEKIEALLLDSSTPTTIRQTILSEAAKAISYQPEWVPVFISLLEAPESEIRVVAAQGLARADIKPTIVNPSFWRAAERPRLQGEIQEWRAWWAQHQHFYVNPAKAR